MFLPSSSFYSHPCHFLVSLFVSLFPNFKLFILCWEIADLKCCGSFRWTVKVLSHTCTCIVSISLDARLLYWRERSFFIISRCISALQALLQRQVPIIIAFLGLFPFLLHGYFPIIGEKKKNLHFSIPFLNRVSLTSAHFLTAWHFPLSLRTWKEKFAVCLSRRRKIFPSEARVRE